MDASQQAGYDDELIIGYVPAFRDENDWRLVFRQQRRGAGGTVVRRVVWDNCRDPHRRFLVDVAEGFTSKDAASRLEAEERDSNVPLERGSSDLLGPKSLVYSKEKPWTQYIRVANLAIWVFSCGRNQFGVTEWVERIHRELEVEKPTSRNSDLKLMPDHDVDGSPGAIYLRFSLEWDRGEWAWWKFKATAGKLEKAEGNRFILRPDAIPNEASVTGWAIEPGRETYWGRYPSYA